MPAENIKFGSCTLESDRFITVCETGLQQVAIVDLHAGNTVTRQKMAAEAAIMNPVSKVIALRGEFFFYSVALSARSLNFFFNFLQLVKFFKFSTWNFVPR
jgi:clathrin heavy chain